MTKGELVVNRAQIADMGTLEWRIANTPNSNWRFVAIVDNIALNRANEKANIYCSSYKTVTAGDTYDGVMGVSNNVVQHKVIVCDMSYTDDTAFKTAMSGVQLVYELATPITYTLTPTEVRTLLGTNNLWADCGDTEVEYRADTEMYITKKITEVVSALS